MCIACMSEKSVRIECIATILYISESEGLQKAKIVYTKDSPGESCVPIDATYMIYAKNSNALLRWYNYFFPPSLLYTRNDIWMICLPLGTLHFSRETVNPIFNAVLCFTGCIQNHLKFCNIDVFYYYKFTFLSEFFY